MTDLEPWRVAGLLAPMLLHHARTAPDPSADVYNRHGTVARRC
jgi:hypothetical protein